MIYKKSQKKVDDKGLNINVKSNSTIWSIFNADSESLLTSIAGHKFIQPVDEKEELEFEKQNKATGDIKGSVVQLPKGGIPNNPTDTKITADYVFPGSIFDEN